MTTLMRGCCCSNGTSSIRAWSTSLLTAAKKWQRSSNSSRLFSTSNGFMDTATTPTTATVTASTGSKKYDVQIVEVGPRDGLQNEPATVCATDKVKLIRLLINAGCSKIEVGSFVNTQVVPNMANTHKVIQRLSSLRRKANRIDDSIDSTDDSNDDDDGIRSSNSRNTAATVKFSVLVPTKRYLPDASIYRDTIDEIAIFASASESFSQMNLNCSIEESMIRFQEIMSFANEINIPVRGYLSCVIGCPYDGTTSPKRVAELTEQLLTLGCYEVALSDTIGVGTPPSIKCMVDDALIAAGGQSNLLAVHFHDTYGQALSNIMVSLDRGITTIDSSLAGLGGCPYAKGATGNVATEDVVYMLNGMGITTGIDIEKMVTASEFICDIVGHSSNSKAGSAIAAKRQKGKKERTLS